jgi:hypothetical protein
MLLSLVIRNKIFFKISIISITPKNPTIHYEVLITAFNFINLFTLLQFFWLN